MPFLSTSHTSNDTSGTATNSTSTNGTTGTSTSATFSPELNDLMGQLVSYTGSTLTNPTKALAPIRDAGLDQINTEYANVPKQVSAQLASRGYGSSGLTGPALTQVALAKAGAQSGLEGTLASDALTQQNTSASLAEQLLGLGRGTDTSTSTTGGTTSTGTSSSNSNGSATPSILNTISGLANLLLHP